MPKPPHFIWEAYKGLTQMRRLTEAEAIETLEDIWPGYPVHELVRAEGDEAKALAALHGTSQGPSTPQGDTIPGSEDMNTLMRGPTRRGRLSGPENGQQAAPEDMNTIIRGRARSGRPTVAQDANQPPAIADDDFIRQRYTERYRSQGQG